ncbi:hypothetical protein HaLaN_05142, partial [Haematococcus lacustris]
MSTAWNAAEPCRSMQPMSRDVCPAVLACHLMSCGGLLPSHLKLLPRPDCLIPIACLALLHDTSPAAVVAVAISAEPGRHMPLHGSSPFHEDVSETAAMEHMLADLAESQLTMASQIFPKHIIEYMATSGPSFGPEQVA